MVFHGWPSEMGKLAIAVARIRLIGFKFSNYYKPLKWLTVDVRAARRP